MIDFNETCYLAAVWYVGGRGQGGDWMAALLRKHNDPRLWLTYRFRYYSPSNRRAFDSDDRKNWYSGPLGDGVSEVEARAHIDAIASMIAQRHGIDVDRVDVDGDPMSFVDKAADRPWVHIKRIPIN